jgi:hypothetical protein
MAAAAPTMPRAWNKATSEPAVHVDKAINFLSRRQMPEQQYSALELSRLLPDVRACLVVSCVLFAFIRIRQHGPKRDLDTPGIVLDITQLSGTGSQKSIDICPKSW